MRSQRSYKGEDLEYDPKADPQVNFQNAVLLNARTLRPTVSFADIMTTNRDGLFEIIGELVDIMESLNAYVQKASTYRDEQQVVFDTYKDTMQKTTTLHTLAKALDALDLNIGQANERITTAETMITALRAFAQFKRTEY